MSLAIGVGNARLNYGGDVPRRECRQPDLVQTLHLPQASQQSLDAGVVGQFAVARSENDEQWALAARTHDMLQEVH